MEEREKCRWPDGMDVKPDGVHSLDPCVYETVEVVENATVYVNRCSRCGHYEILWKRNV